VRKSSSPRDIPPPLELECLKALWRIGHGTVKDVRGIVTENRNLAYTTVMTVLDRLVKRGRVERRKQGRSFLYTPLVGKQELRRLAVQTLIDSFFDGTAGLPRPPSGAHAGTRSRHRTGTRPAHGTRAALKRPPSDLNPAPP